MTASHYTAAAYKRHFLHTPQEDDVKGVLQELLGEEKTWYKVVKGDPEVIHEVAREEWVLCKTTLQDSSKVAAMAGQVQQTMTTRSAALLDQWKAQPSIELKKIEIKVLSQPGQPGETPSASGGDKADGKSVATMLDLAARDEEGDLFGRTPPSKKAKTASFGGSPAASGSQEEMILATIAQVQIENDDLLKLMVTPTYRDTLTNARFAQQDSKLANQASLAKSGGSTKADITITQARKVWGLAKKLLKAFDEFLNAKRGANNKIEAVVTLYKQAKDMPVLGSYFPPAIEEAVSKNILARAVADRKVGEEHLELLDIDRIAHRVGSDKELASTISDNLMGLLVNSHSLMKPAHKNATNADYCLHMSTLTKRIMGKKMVLSAPIQSALSKIHAFLIASPPAGENLDQLLEYFALATNQKLPLMDIFCATDAYNAAKMHVDSVNRLMKASSDINERLCLIEEQYKHLGTELLVDSLDPLEYFASRGEESETLAHSLLNLSTGSAPNARDRKAAVLDKMSNFRDATEKSCLKFWSNVVHQFVDVFLKGDAAVPLETELLKDCTDKFIAAMLFFTKGAFSKIPTKVKPVLSATEACTWAKDWYGMLSSLAELNELVLGHAAMGQSLDAYQTGVATKFAQDRTGVIRALVAVATYEKRLESWESRPTFPWANAVKATSKSLPALVIMKTMVMTALKTLATTSFQQAEASLPDALSELATLDPEMTSGRVFLPAWSKLVADAASESICKGIAETAIAKDDTSNENLAKAMCLILKDQDKLKQTELRYELARARCKIVQLIQVVKKEIRDIRPDGEYEVMHAYANLLFVNILQPCVQLLTSAAAAQKKYLAKDDDLNAAVFTSMSEWIAANVTAPVLKKICAVGEALAGRVLTQIPAGWEVHVQMRSTTDVLQLMITENFVKFIDPVGEVIDDICKRLLLAIKTIRAAVALAVSDDIASDCAALDTRCKKVAVYAASTTALSLMLRVWPSKSRHERAGQLTAFLILV